MSDFQSRLLVAAASQVAQTSSFTAGSSTSTGLFSFSDLYSHIHSLTGFYLPRELEDHTEVLVGSKSLPLIIAGSKASTEVLVI